MNEDSAVRYWEGYGKIAFDAGQRSIYTTCTLKIPLSLTRGAGAGGSGSGGGESFDAENASMDGLNGLAVVDNNKNNSREEYREVRCCFSVTIRRDAWGIPVAIMGQWIVS